VERYLAKKYGLWHSTTRQIKVSLPDAINYLVSNRVSGESATYVQWKMRKYTVPEPGWGFASNAWFIRDLTVKAGSDIILGNKSSSWEYAFKVGADADIEADYGFFGGVHQGQAITEWTFTLDGRDVTGMAVGEIRFGALAHMRQSLNTYYPKDKTTVVGASTIEHRWGETALDVEYTHAFSDGYSIYQCYSAMVPTTSAGTPAGIDTYKIGDNSAAARVFDDGAKNKPTETATALFYHSTAHAYRLTMTLPTGYPGNNTWAYSGNWKVWFLDGVDADNGKAYANWIDGEFADRIEAIASTHQIRYVVSKV
jgi:hypothetical protein